MTVSRPVVIKVDNILTELNQEYREYKESYKKRGKLLFSFPTVYMHNCIDNDHYEVYVGETNNIFQRTAQHSMTGLIDESSWQHKFKKFNPTMYVIAHEHFNKSLTLDIENKLIHYMSSIENVNCVNRRDNAQRSYYPDNELEEIFSAIWKELRKQDKNLFPAEDKVRDSAIFKASPLHKLTDAQFSAQQLIIQKVIEALKSDDEHVLIFVEGEAGTGKTVLNSSTFYELYCQYEDENSVLHKVAGDDFKCCMIVNHNEQVTVYQQIIKKLNIAKGDMDLATKATTFINKYSKDNPIDVAFVDEAHLLWTQGKQGYSGKNQLIDIMDRSKVTVVMFDENQILGKDAYWEDSQIFNLRNKAVTSNNHIILDEQLRMQASEEIIDWIDSFTKHRILKNIPEDSNCENNKKKYEIKVFDTPRELELAIKQKANQEDSKLSRMIATYDWDYIGNKLPTSEQSPTGMWEVHIDDWHKPWNYGLWDLHKKIATRKEKKDHDAKAWAEQESTIDEIGSTFTIQGFDLHYAGIILGPSVKYRNGKIVSDKNESKSNNAVHRRTLSDGTLVELADEFLKHELRVLMTRGVNGLYIYACDDALREALKKASNGEL